MERTNSAPISSEGASLKERPPSSNNWQDKTYRNYIYIKHINIYTVFRKAHTWDLLYIIFTARGETSEMSQPSPCGDIKIDFDRDQDRLVDEAQG